MPSYTVSILRHDDSSDLFTFDEASVIIGREAGHIVTGDPLVSTRHAELKFTAGVLTFVDLNSTNGTFTVSGERLSSPLILTPGTALKLGGSTLAVQDIDAGFVERGATQVMTEVPAGLKAAAKAAAEAEAAAKAAAAPAPVAAPAPPAVAAPAAAQSAAAPEASAAPAPQASASAQPSSGAGDSISDSLGEAADRVGEAAERMGDEIERIAAAGPQSEGLIDQLKYYLAYGAKLYKEHYVNGALTMGLVMVPATALGFVFSKIPFLGFVLGIVLLLAQLALAPISTGAMGRWALAAASGRSLTWKEAWSAALKNPVQEWLNLAVSSIITGIGFMFLFIPGVLLGMFAVPSYLLEKKKFVGINMRSLELVLKDPGRHLGLAVLIFCVTAPVMIVGAILSFAFSFIPAVGAPLGELVTMSIAMLALPYVYLLWSLIYFDSRKKIEEVDALAEGAQEMDSWKSAP